MTKQTQVIILIMNVALSVFSCSSRETRVVNDPITGKPFEKYEVKETDDGSILKDGFYKKWYRNGQIQIDCNFILNKRDGSYKQYYDNGQVEMDATFKQDSADGHYIKYYRTGKKMWEGDYSFGKQVGDWKAWFENGQQTSIQKYDHNGRQDGEQKYWFSNGRISLIGESKHGEMIDTWRGFDDNGEPNRIYKYDAGVDVGIVGKWKVNNGNIIDYLADNTFLMVEPAGKQFKGTYRILKDRLEITAPSGFGSRSFQIDKLLEIEYRITSTQNFFSGKNETFTAKRIF